MSDPKRYDEFAGLVRRHSSQLLSYINALLLNWNDAEDVFQDTCLVGWQKFGEFAPGTNFLAWILRIADYRTMAFQRKQSRLSAFNARLRDAMMTELVGRGDAHEGGLAALPGCLHRLPETDRKMVMDRYGESVPVRQIADALGRSTQSVHHSLCRIRKQLLGCIRRELRHFDATASRKAIVEEGLDHE